MLLYTSAPSKFRGKYLTLQLFILPTKLMIIIDYNSVEGAILHNEYFYFEVHVVGDTSLLLSKVLNSGLVMDSFYIVFLLLCKMTCFYHGV